MNHEHLQLDFFKAFDPDPIHIANPNIDRDFIADQTPISRTLRQTEENIFRDSHNALANKSTGVSRAIRSLKWNN